MVLPSIEPPLVNSANPWATSLEDLQNLFDCEHTGAVTIRTSLLSGFAHDSAVHQYTFFDADDHETQPANRDSKDVPDSFGGSLNTLGYSPVPLSQYLLMVSSVVNGSQTEHTVRARKPWIISVTGSSEAVVQCYRSITKAQAAIANPLCMEINLSCPNIPDKPPPAYSGTSLAEYLKALAAECSDAEERKVAIGIKTPPYTYHDQFKTLIDALLTASSPSCPVDFITATNTLGSSLVLADNHGTPALASVSGAGIGGMAGSPLHPLALGNVKTIRTMLDQHQQLQAIKIIGVGGVSDSAGFERMRAVGAEIVGVGTALGREGVDIFKKILHGSK